MKKKWLLAASLAIAMGHENDGSHSYENQQKNIGEISSYDANELDDTDFVVEVQDFFFDSGTKSNRNGFYYASLASERPEQTHVKLITTDLSEVIQDSLILNSEATTEQSTPVSFDQEFRPQSESVKLTRDQVHQVLIIVLGTSAFFVLITVVFIWLRTRFRVRNALRWLYQQTSQQVILERMKIESTTFQEHAAIYIRLLNHDQDVDKLVQIGDAATIDVVQCTCDIRAQTLEDFVNSVNAAIATAEELACKVKKAQHRIKCIAWKNRLLQLKDKCDLFHHDAQETLETIIERALWKTWTLDELNSKWNFFVSLGLSGMEEWYNEARAALTRREDHITRMSVLHEECLESASMENLRALEDCIVKALSDGWVDDRISKMERFVNDMRIGNDQQLIVMNFTQPANAAMDKMQYLINNRELQIQKNIECDQMTRAQATTHVERMIFDYNMHIEKLNAKRQSEETRLRELHNLYEKQRRDKIERDRLRFEEAEKLFQKKNQAKLQRAKLKREQQEQDRLRIQQEKRQEEEKKLIHERQQREWQHAQRWMFWSGCLLLLIFCLMFWDVVSSRGFLSPSCDEGTSWSPFASASKFSCQLFYGLKVTFIIVMIVLIITLFAHLNLPTLGLAVLCTAFLYSFRDVWRDMLVHWKCIVLFFCGHLFIGIWLTKDPYLAWTWRGINLRPLIVYVVYPLASCCCAIAIGIASCPVPTSGFLASYEIVMGMIEVEVDGAELRDIIRNKPVGGKAAEQGNEAKEDILAVDDEDIASPSKADGESTTFTQPESPPPLQASDATTVYAKLNTLSSNSVRSQHTQTLLHPANLSRLPSVHAWTLLLVLLSVLLWFVLHRRNPSIDARLARHEQTVAELGKAAKVIQAHGRPTGLRSLQEFIDRIEKAIVVATALEKETQDSPSCTAWQSILHSLKEQSDQLVMDAEEALDRLKTHAAWKQSTAAQLEKEWEFFRFVGVANDEEWYHKVHSLQTQSEQLIKDFIC